MEDLTILTLLATSLLMFLTLLLMLLTSLLGFFLYGSNIPFIWRFVAFFQAAAGIWSITLGIVWFLYLLFFDKNVSLSCQNGIQCFLYFASLSICILLLIFSGFIAILISYYLSPEEISLNRYRK